MASSNKLEFIQSINCLKPSLTVVEVMPTVTIIKSRDDLLAGTEQQVDLVIRSGSTVFLEVNSTKYTIAVVIYLRLWVLLRRKLCGCVLRGG